MLHRLIVPRGVAPRVDLRVEDDTVVVEPGEDDGAARLLSGAGRPIKLQVVDVGQAAVSVLPPRERVLVVADRFERADLDLLRERGWCGVDRNGQTVVSARTLTVTVERAGATRAVASDPSLSRLRGRAAEHEAAAVRGAVTARLTQLLLEEPGRSWQPTTLAVEDGRATIATASRLLAELRRLGLSTVKRDGRSRRYQIVEPTLLLRWLAERTPPLDRRAVVDGYIRAASFEALFRRVVDHLPPGSVLTGAAATFAENRAVTTSVPIVTVRVDPTYDLATAARDFGLAVHGAARNVRLVSDRGYVGTARPRQVLRVPLAGVVRTWLDLNQEPRGEDAAALYFDTVLDVIEPRRRAAP